MLAADGGPAQESATAVAEKRKPSLHDMLASSDPGRLLRRQVGGAAHVDAGRGAARRAGALHPH